MISGEAEMTSRVLWQNIMHYRGFDRMPVVHWEMWPETYERWHAEGMPETADLHRFFKAAPHMSMIGLNLDLLPAFETEVIEETGDYRIYRDSVGVIQKEWKHKSSIPHYVDFTFKTAKDWERYKSRLQPAAARIPADLDTRIAEAERSGGPVTLWCGSLMGWPRNWMGVENLSYLMYDRPDIFEDMVNTLADLARWGIDQVAPRLKSPADMGHLWEDICGKTGPLVSPAIFKKYVAPGYRKIRCKLESYGTSLLSVDCDGDISELTGLWLDTGVNIQIPFEIGTWNPDPMEYRKKFGKSLRIMGGFNKYVLERDKAAIDEEIARRLPLMRDGGYVIMPDHAITPDTPLENYQYYLDRIRELSF